MVFCPLLPLPDCHSLLPTFCTKQQWEMFSLCRGAYSPWTAHVCS